MAVSYEQELLASLLPQWQSLLQGWSADGSLTSAAQEALLLNGEPHALTDLVTQWSVGDFSSIPPIVLLSSTDISGAMGAYAISTGTIYLNQDWLRSATQDQVNAVLTEELGHFLDGLLNAVDTPGDEGEMFHRCFTTASLPPQAELTPSENDTLLSSRLTDERQIVSLELASSVAPNDWTRIIGSPQTDLLVNSVQGQGGSFYSLINAGGGDSITEDRL